MKSTYNVNITMNMPYTVDDVRGGQIEN